MVLRILKSHLAKILDSKSLLLLGPRQVGKSTIIESLNPSLTIQLADERVFIDHLKDPSLLTKMVKAPRKDGFILIDEVQRIPSLLNTVQALVDKNKNLRFALSGSSARKLSRGKANLLPGRVIFERLYPLTYWELKPLWDESLFQKILVQGSLPEIITSDIGIDILESYTEIYLREEIQAEALTKDIGEYSRFLDMAAEVSGQHINYSKLASSIESNKEKIRRYFDILLETLLIFRLDSLDVKTGRKVRQKDRFYFFDNGVRNAVLKKHRSHFTPTEMGPLFESWMYLQINAFISYNKKNWKLSSYRDDKNLEVDLIIEGSKGYSLIEFKYQKKYRPEFSAPGNELEVIIGKKKVFQKIIVYLGEETLKGDAGELVLPYKIFLDELSVWVE